MRYCADVLCLARMRGVKARCPRLAITDARHTLTHVTRLYLRFTHQSRFLRWRFDVLFTADACYISDARGITTHLSAAFGYAGRPKTLLALKPFSILLGITRYSRYYRDGFPLHIRVASVLPFVALPVRYALLPLL